MEQITAHQTSALPKAKKSYIGYCLGFAGILALAGFVFLNWASVYGPKWCDRLYERSAGVIFFGSYLLIAIGSIIIGRQKRRLGLGLFMVLFGPLGFLIMVFVSRRS